MLPSRSRLERWNPDTLTFAGQSITDTGTAIEDAVTAVSTNIATMPDTRAWSGDAHAAAASMFERAAKQGHREPFALPRRWLEGQAKLDLDTPFNFVSTADTIGGNSGSPVLNRAGELVGINFDRNRPGLVRNFVYTDVGARHIAVHGRAVLEALRQLYGAEDLARELTGE